MPFEVFKSRLAPRPSEVTVTIGQRGQMTISEAAYELLGRPVAVEFLYAADDQVMALRSVDRTVEHAYTVKTVAKAKSRHISAMAFMTYYGIETRPTRRRRAELHDDLLCIDLKDPGMVVIGNRGKRDGNAD